MADKYSGMVLASASPRRRQLLKQAGHQFTVFPAKINEADFACDRISPAEYAKRAALAKARQVAEKFGESLVIGADTVVDFQGRIIGKPADEKQAERIIRKLCGAPHKVITAVALVRLSEGLELVESDTTTVYPKKMSERQIAEHIKSGSWRDKAGAYAIKEDADPFIEKLQGSLTNVMGLPMELLDRLLARAAR